MEIAVSFGAWRVLDAGVSDSISDLTARIRTFVAAREWQQFHNPKDMAVAITVEAGELLQHFVWQQPDQVEKRADERRDEIASEIADVGILLFEMADLLGMNLGEVMETKIARNEQRYPAPPGYRRLYDAQAVPQQQYYYDNRGYARPYQPQVYAPRPYYQPRDMYN